MEILLVEDSANFAARLQKAVSHTVMWRVAQTRDDALDELSKPPADLAVCDLKIPASQVEPAADTAHGLAVFDAVRLRWPGVPIVVLSSYADLDMLDERLAAAPIVDFLGRGDLRLARHVKKDRVDELVKELNEYSVALFRLQAEVELAGGDDLAGRDARLVRLYAKRREARVVRVRRFRGGKSGAVTVGLDLKESLGSGTQAVVKLNDISEVLDEFERYRAHVMDRVQIGSYTPHSDLLDVGAGGRGALFYRLADGFDRDLYEVLRQSPEDAARVVDLLRVATSPWVNSATVENVTVGTVRRLLAKDAVFDGLADAAPWGSEELESCQLEATWARQHGDLHGENVLVDAELRPMIIDFGRAGRGTAALDPVTLEISAVLQPEARLDLGEWMTPSRAESWMNETEYLEGCPIAPFVHACRGWMQDVSRGNREIAATAYGYALRQLRYSDVDPQLAAALSFGAAQYLLRQYGM